jgi:hypothetical protein
LIVGLLTVLFLFKGYATSNTIPNFQVYGITFKVETFWAIDVIGFFATLVLLALSSFLNNLEQRWTAYGAIYLYRISVV